MKNKYIKPEIDIMMNIIISSDDDKDRKGNIILGADDNIGGGTVSGEDDGNW